MRRIASLMFLVALTTPVYSIGFHFAIRIITFGRVSRVVPVSYRLIPDQSVQIRDVALKPPQQKCENWSWAANTQTVLSLDHIDLSQADWVTRVEGGELCKEEGPDFATMSRAISGDYELTDGRRVHIDVVNVTGAPTVVDDLIASLRQNHPLLMFWKGHGYILTGVRYDEYVAPTGGRMFVINKLNLLDPFATADKQQVTFDRDNDDPNDIQGIMDIRASEVIGQSWLHPEDEYTKNHRSPAERQTPPASPLEPVPPQTWTPGQQPTPEPAK